MGGPHAYREREDHTRKVGTGQMLAYRFSSYIVRHVTTQHRMPSPRGRARHLREN